MGTGLFQPGTVRLPFQEYTSNGLTRHSDPQRRMSTAEFRPTQWVDVRNTRPAESGDAELMMSEWTSRMTRQPSSNRSEASSRLLTPPLPQPAFSMIFEYPAARNSRATSPGKFQALMRKMPSSAL